ncbi:MAG: hypothetical protein KAX80_01940 [Planctomycetes bacterium]|nr:hypothetical protein [Planctomycetota bacterium]
MSGKRYPKVGVRLGFSVVLAALATGFTFGQEMPAGLAQKYPGDVGIEEDEAVVFVENFETGELKDICARWGDARADNLTLSDDVSTASPGKRSLRIAHHGHLYTHTSPVDQLFARYYIKFHEKCGYTHHLPFIIADGQPTPWPKGWGGKKPRGDDFFLTGLDAWGEWGTLQPPGKWMLYTYWQEMKPDGRGDYWGNNFKVDDQEPIQRGQWICCEFMVKANSSPDKADGEQAFWIDGKLVGRFQGFRWRSTDALKINSFWLEHDNDTHDLNKDADHPDRVYDVWFDDIVLATSYVGPITPAE